MLKREALTLPSLSLLFDEFEDYLSRLLNKFISRITPNSNVFPTHVGVIKGERFPIDVIKCIPHACGGYSS